MMGCLRYTALERVEIEDPQEFEDAFVEMIMGQLQLQTTVN